MQSGKRRSEGVGARDTQAGGKRREDRESLGCSVLGGFRQVKDSTEEWERPGCTMEALETN